MELAVYIYDKKVILFSKDNRGTVTLQILNDGGSEVLFIKHSGSYLDRHYTRLDETSF